MHMRTGMFIAAALAAAAGFAAPAAGQLMVVDSTNDQVMLFSKASGELVDAAWLTDAGAVGWAFGTPKEALVVGTEVWVSDQIEDAILRFDLSTRVYLGSITAVSNGTVLDNVRGMGFDGTTVYITNAAPTANRGVAMYSTDGTPTGFFPVPASLFDVEPFEGGLLISNDATDDIERWTVDGAFVSTFAAGINFPEQVLRHSDGSVICVSSITAAPVEGVYHFNADGSLRKFIDTEVLKLQIGEQVPRGAFLLDDGGYLIATSVGVYKAVEMEPGTFMFLAMATGVNAQHISDLGGDTGPACPADWNGDETVNSSDISSFLTSWLASVTAPNTVADFNQDGVTNSSDISAFLTAWLDAVVNGC